jgi:quinol monooxygenase YgiN
MGINILTEFKTKPGRSEDLEALLQELVPQSLEHGGAEEICIRQNQDDPNDIVSAQRWASRQVYLDYRGWRSDSGTTARIQEMLRASISVRFFEDVATAPPDCPNEADGFGHDRASRCIEARLRPRPRALSIFSSTSVPARTSRHRRAEAQR